MSLEKPQQTGALVIRTKYGRLEHLKGDGKNALFRAYKYELNAKGEPVLIECEKRGLTDEVRTWFRDWSVDGSITEVTALSVSAYIDKLKDQIKEAKDVAEKKPRSATSQDVKEFLDEVNVLDVVNTKTQYLHTKFIDWCHSKEINPCSSTMTTRQACGVLGLITVNGVLRPKSWKKPGEA